MLPNIYSFVLLFIFFTNVFGVKKIRKSSYLPIIIENYEFISLETYIISGDIVSFIRAIEREPELAIEPIPGINRSPLSLICEIGNYDLFKILLRFIKPNYERNIFIQVLFSKDSIGIEPIYYALNGGHLKIVSSFIRTKNYNFFNRITTIHNPLKQTFVMKLFLKQREMHYLFECSFIKDLFSILLNNICWENINHLDENGKTIFSLFLESYPNVSPNFWLIFFCKFQKIGFNSITKRSDFHIIIDFCTPEILELVLKKIPIFSSSLILPEFHACISYAASKNRFDFVDVFLCFLGNQFERTIRKETVGYAIKFQYDKLNILLNNYEDFDDVDLDGLNIIHRGIHSGSLNVLKAILSSINNTEKINFLLNFPNNDGLIPIDLLKYIPHSSGRMRYLLLEYGSPSPIETLKSNSQICIIQ